MRGPLLLRCSRRACHAWETPGGICTVFCSGKLQNTRSPETWNRTERAGMVATFRHSQVRCVLGRKPMSVELQSERYCSLTHLSNNSLALPNSTNTMTQHHAQGVIDAQGLLRAQAQGWDRPHS